ncbi:MAG TPA: hypothetical protein DCO79_00075 [Spirochaeta sp.]|nr:hypothetical protein [Spirochaeta sp.]
MKKQLIILLAAAVIVFSSCSTIKSSTDVIPPSVDEFLQKNGTDFNNYEISDLGAEFEFDEQSYNVYESIEAVWQYYMRVDPVLAFDSRIIDFGIVFNPGDSVVYNAANFSQIGLGFEGSSRYKD